MKIKFYIKNTEDKNVAGAQVTIYDETSTPVVEFTSANRYKSLDLEPMSYLISVTSPNTIDCSVSPFLLTVKNNDTIYLEDAYASKVLVDDNSIIVKFLEDIAVPNIDVSKAPDITEDDMVSEVASVESKELADSTPTSEVTEPQVIEPVKVESPQTADTHNLLTSIKIPKGKFITLRFGQRTQRYSGILKIESQTDKYAVVQFKAPGSGRIIKCNVKLEELQKFM